MRYGLQNYRNAQERKESTLQNVNSAADLLIGIQISLIEKSESKTPH
jgi:hypothetical protein